MPSASAAWPSGRKQAPGSAGRPPSLGAVYSSPSGLRSLSRASCKYIQKQQTRREKVNLPPRSSFLFLTNVRSIRTFVFMHTGSLSCPQHLYFRCHAYRFNVLPAAPALPWSCVQVHCLARSACTSVFMRTGSPPRLSRLHPCDWQSRGLFRSGISSCLPPSRS